MLYLLLQGKRKGEGRRREGYVQQTQGRYADIYSVLVPFVKRFREIEPTARDQQWPQTHDLQSGIIVNKGSYNVQL